MKKIIAAIAAVSILLSGCGVINDNNERGRDIPGVELDVSDLGYQGRVEKLAVYFLNATSGTLTAEIRTIVIGQDINPAEVAVKELLKGPTNSKLLTGVAPDGMSLDKIEYSRDVANVYLKYNGELNDQYQKFVLELAISNTVTDILGTTYTSVFYNGIQTGFSGKPYSPIKKQTGSIEDAWLQASLNYDKIPSAYLVGIPETEPTASQAPQDVTPSAEIIETKMPTVLYFLSKDEGYILPEVRNVKYINGNYIQTIIAELSKGPQNASIMDTPLAKDLELAQDPIFTPSEEGGYVLTLNFTKPPTRYDILDTDDSLLSYAAMTYTLTSLIPGVRSIDILVNGNRVDLKNGPDGSEMIKRSDCFGLMGSSVPLYFADKNSDLLLEVSRSMEEGRTWSAKARLTELLKGPLSGDEENAWPVMPSGIQESDIISVNVYTDTAYIDLSDNFKNACSGLSSKNEMLLVYSIVNTITAMDGVNKVQFLVNGQQTETLAGYLCLSDPFLKNYGIIKRHS